MFNVCSMSKLYSSTSKTFPAVSDDGSFDKASLFFEKSTCDSAAKSGLLYGLNVI